MSINVEWVMLQFMPPPLPPKRPEYGEEIEKEKKPFPIVTLSFILINTIMFIAAPILMNGFMNVLYTLAFTPADILIFRNLHSFITHMFIHLDPIHIFMNMAVFFMFAPSVERKMGSRQFSLFYMTCGIIAIFTHFCLYSSSDTPVVGASGAIYGVLGAYALLFPTKKVHVRFVRVPAILGIPLAIFVQLLYASPNVAHFAHIGGFIGGIILIRRIRPETVGFIPKFIDTILAMLIPEPDDDNTD